MKKHLQLGMNPATASYRLVKDLLFKFVIDSGHVCFRCQATLTREDFSIEHKKPWLDSDDPVSKFFDLSNIAFSHKSCNFAAAKRPLQKYESAELRKRASIRRRYDDPLRYAKHLERKRIAK